MFHNEIEAITRTEDLTAKDNVLNDSGISYAVDFEKNTMIQISDYSVLTRKILKLKMHKASFHRCKNILESLRKVNGPIDFYKKFKPRKQKFRILPNFYRKYL